MIGVQTARVFINAFGYTKLAGRINSKSVAEVPLAPGGGQGLPEQTLMDQGPITTNEFP